MGSNKAELVNRNRFIIGGVLLALFLILSISGSMNLFREWKNGQAQVGQRVPLQNLGYCSTQQIKPCILSFNLDADGNMLVNILADRSGPDFYLKIKSNETENTYKCQNTNGVPATITCKGKIVPLGVILQFLMISTDGDTPFAEGRFQVIGLALATPKIASTPSLETPLVSSTDNFLLKTPTPTGVPSSDGPYPSPTNAFFTTTPTSIGGPPNSGPPSP